MYAHASQRAASGQTERISKIDMSLTLLIIDDSKLNLKLTELMLQKIDCRTDAFSDAREALRSVKDHDYDLVFMDYLMPDINGIEATRLIRSMSGGIHSDPDYYKNDSVMQQRMIDNGIDDVLLKPFKLDDVCAVIDKWCGTSLRTTVSSKSSRAHHAERTGHSGSSLPKIFGITDETLKEMIHVDRDGFLETLTIFTEDNLGKHARIDEALSSEDYETYCVEIHRIKGETAMIGAYTVSEDAAHLNELGKALKCGDMDPITYERTLRTVTSGTVSLLKYLDDLCSSADEFLCFAGRKQRSSDAGLFTPLSQDFRIVGKTADRKIDREKLIRYISHAREALDCGDIGLAKEWLSEIGAYLKK